MTNLFKKAIVFTDVHYGMKHNSSQHNEDCNDFVRWMIEEGKLRDAETCIFCGDFFHHRNTINSQTLKYAIEAISMLNDSFEKTYIIVGNHDMYLRDSREIISTEFTTLFPNVTLIDSITVTDNVALVPWLIKEEWKDIADIKAKYIFGHFELPGFKMNAQVEMPDHGEINASHFTHSDYIFSGHFHMRQTKGKISYIGNPFGHNYSDVWDFERGAMFLEWDKEPEFIDYADGPRYITINLAALLANPDIYLKPKTYLQVTLDVDITYEEAAFLRETFLTQYNVREFKLIRNPEDDLTKEFTGDITLKTVDQIVIECLNTLDNDSKFDISKFIEIYNNL